jgi:hypothetical protein
MVKLSWLFKFIDVYGQGISLTLNKKKSTTTVIGGILTIITVGLLIAATWSTGKDIFYHLQPIISFEDQLFTRRPYVNLDSYNFPMAMAVQDYSQNTFDLPRYFTPEIILSKVYNSNGTTINRNLEMEMCTYEHFPNLSLDYLVKAGVTNYFCLKKNQNTTIGGYWDDESITYLILRLKLCINKNQSDTSCASLEEIKKFIINHSTALDWNLYYQDSIINANNYEKPVQYFLNVLYRNFVLDSYKMYNIFIRQQEVTTDDGFLLQNKYSESSIGFDRSDSDDSQITSDFILVDINLYISNHKPIYHRKYIKIQEILANIGGLAKAVMMISSILSYCYSEYKKDEIILNTVFDFIYQNQSENKSVIKTSQNNILEGAKNLSYLYEAKNIGKNDQQKLGNNFDFKINPDASSFNSIRNFEIIKKIEKNNNPKMFRKQKIKKEEIDRLIKEKSKSLKIHYSFFDVTKLIFCKYCIKGELQQKYKVLQKCEEKINQYLDIRFFIQKLDEFDKFKFILLEEEQLAMFHFISKFKCSLGDYNYEEGVNKLEILTKENEKMFRILEDYHRRMILPGRKSANKLDEKLYSLVNSHIKEILDKMD